MPPKEGSDSSSKEGPASTQTLPHSSFLLGKTFLPTGSQLSQSAAQTQAVILIQNQIPVCSPPNRGCCTCNSQRWLMVTVRLPRGCKSNGHRGMRTAELTPPSTALLSELLQGQKIRNAGSHHPACPEGAWLLWQCG